MRLNHLTPTTAVPPSQLPSSAARPSPVLQLWLSLTGCRDVHAVLQNVSEWPPTLHSPLAFAICFLCVSVCSISLPLPLPPQPQLPHTSLPCICTDPHLVSWGRTDTNICLSFASIRWVCANSRSR